MLAPIAGDSYAMNAADLAGSGSFSSGGLSANNLGVGSMLISQAPKMIPVPGLPPQQQSLQQPHLLQQQMQQLQQRTNLQNNNVMVPRGQPQGAQQQLHLNKSQSLYQSQAQQSGGPSMQKQPGVCNAFTTLFLPVWNALLSSPLKTTFKWIVVLSS